VQQRQQTLGREEAVSHHPDKNGEMIAASAVVPEASPICSPENWSVCPARHGVTDQAPQT
jgi:hypothetical protein